ncbi:MAG: mechanosensitive ion channel [SAR324 cluster bacterium]|nr:mechanosensitive ion channel [SAR324 cluster bacterium]
MDKKVMPPLFRSNRCLQVLILILLLFTLSFGGYAQDTNAPLPNPIDLQPGWWSSFVNVDESKLSKQVEALKSSVNMLENSFSRENQDVLKAYVKKLNVNLDLWISARIRTVPAKEKAEAFKTQYTLTQILTLSRQLRKKKSSLNTDQEEIDQLSVSVNTLEHQIDNQMARYLQLTDHTAIRMEPGLQLMADQVVLAVSTEQLKYRKSLFIQNERDAELTRKELEYAQKHITANAEELKTAEREIKTLAVQLKDAQQALLAVESQSVGSNEDRPTSKAQSRLTGTKHTHAEAKYGLIFLELERKRSQQQLLSLLVQPKNINLAAMQSQLKNFQSLLGQTNKKLEIWLEKTSQEHLYASQTLSNLNNDKVSGHPALKKIHQQILAQSQANLLLLQDIDAEVDLGRTVRSVFEQKLAAHQGYLKQTIISVKDQAVNFWEMLIRWLSQSLFTIEETPVTPLGILRVFLILGIAAFMSRAIQSGLQRLTDLEKGFSESANYTLGRLLHYALITLGTIVGLSSIGIDFSKLALIAGALSVGIGFGLQSIFNNFVSGLILLFERPIKVGDKVELESGVRGIIREINVRSTRIETLDNIDILVPNSEFISGRVINLTLTNAQRRIHIPFGVAYGTDKDLVAKAAVEAAESLDYLMKSDEKYKPLVRLINFGDSSLDFELLVWVDDKAIPSGHMVETDCLWHIETALSKYNIEIPFPQRDVHIKESS